MLLGREYLSFAGKIYQARATGFRKWWQNMPSPWLLGVANLGFLVQYTNLSPLGHRKQGW